jgi:hypothetical protein
MDHLVTIFSLSQFSLSILFSMDANDDLSLRTTPTYQETVGIRAALANKLAN